MSTTFRSNAPGIRHPRQASSKFNAAKAPVIAAPRAPPAITAEQLEEILRKFDLNPRYGPFVGMDRMDRWERAERLGLEPPPAVRKLLTLSGAVAQRQGGSLW